jgi:CheY-like chemotaxis protein/HPt (histidine-containing phosphotransfer) domain-containing protein
VSTAKIDRFFAGLFLVEWLSRIGFAWSHQSQPEDVFTAIVLGAAIASVPTLLVFWKPGTVATRHAVAVTQMLYGALLVHLAHGEFETSFHVFLSLALLALYRDFTVLVSASAIAIGYGFVLGDVAHASVLAMWIVISCAALVVGATRNRRDVRAHEAEIEAMRRDLLAAVNVGIREPMNAILGSAELIQGRADPRSQIQRIQRQSQRLLSVLDDMSDATKIQPEMQKQVVENHQSQNLESNVLLVDDVPDNQRVLGEYLINAGVSVTFAANGEEALAVVAGAKKPFDLILMDMQMPVLDGYAATTELRKRGYRGPIIAMSARATSNDRRRCLDVGCTEVLTKPIARERLLQAALGATPTIPPAPVEEPIYSDYADVEDMAELLEGFVTRLRETAAEAARAVGMNDRIELERLSRRLRGAAGSFGFMSISEAAWELEESARSGVDMEKTLKSLQMLCRRARSRALQNAA